MARASWNGVDIVLGSRESRGSEHGLSSLISALVDSAQDEAVAEAKRERIPWPAVMHDIGLHLPACSG